MNIRDRLRFLLKPKAQPGNDRCVEILIYGKVVVIIPQIGNNDDTWFQKEAGTEFYARTGDDPSTVGQLIRLAEARSYEFDRFTLGKAYNKKFLTHKYKIHCALEEKLIADHGVRKARMTGLRQRGFLHWQGDEIVFRPMVQSAEHKGEYDYRHKDPCDNPRLPRNCSYEDLGAMVLNWAKEFLVRR